MLDLYLLERVFYHRDSSFDAQKLLVKEIEVGPDE
jgi:hypothetical protein